MRDAVSSGIDVGDGTTEGHPGSGETVQAVLPLEGVRAAAGAPEVHIQRGERNREAGLRPDGELQVVVVGDRLRRGSSCREIRGAERIAQCRNVEPCASGNVGGVQVRVERGGGDGRFIACSGVEFPSSDLALRDRSAKQGQAEQARTCQGKSWVV